MSSPYDSTWMGRGFELVCDGPTMITAAGCEWIELPYLDGVQHATFPVRP